MKVHICYTVEVDDFYRRALNFRYGKPHLASRSDLKDHFRLNGASMDDDLISELQIHERKE